MITKFEGFMFAEEGQKNAILKTGHGETVIGTVETDDQVRIVLHVVGPDGHQGSFIATDIDGEGAQSISQSELYRQMIRQMIGTRSQQKWAHKIGFHVDTVKRWLSGSRIPTAGIMLGLLRSHGIMSPIKIK